MHQERAIPPMSITALRSPEPPASERCSGLITQLVLRCGQGDESALGELFDLTFFLVAAVVKRDALSPTGFDDEVVDAFRRIWGRSAAYEPTASGVLAWVFDQVVDEETDAASHATTRTGATA